MYWSVYDTLLLVTGLLTAAIALIPIAEIPTKTRVTSAAIGGGLVLLSLILGNMPSFTYPSLVMVAPVLPVIAGGVIAKAALDRRRADEALAAGRDDGALQYGDQGHAASPPAARARTDGPSPAASGSAEPGVVPPSAPAVREPAGRRDAAWTALFDSTTSAEELAAIAAAHPEFASTIAAHPNAYPQLKTWAASVQPG